MFDLVIYGGTVVDGTGAPSVEADIAIRGTGSPLSVKCRRRRLDPDSMGGARWSLQDLSTFTLIRTSAS
jgi:hypothetical protein